MFTTDGYGNKMVFQPHTYVFMAWVKEGNYDYAYICDNQTKDYENKIYHIRNIKKCGQALMDTPKMLLAFYGEIE